LADSSAALGRVNVASDLPAIFTLAKALSKAQGFIPQHLKNEGEIAAVILAGQELGLAPMISLRSLRLIKGNVTLAADVQLALMIRAGAKIRWISDGSDGHAKLEVTRPGQAPYVSQFSLEMAKKAGLLNNDNYQKHPASMLRARCVSSAGRAYMPDVLAGCYVPGEIEEDVPAQPSKPLRAVRTLDDVASAAPAQKPASVRPPPATTDARAHDEHTGEVVDEYGLAIPASACPIFQSGPDKGKPYIEVSAHKLQALLDTPAYRQKATEPMIAWAEYRIARREREKELEEAEARVNQQQAEHSEVEGEVMT
jgi:hypothetical protein